MEISGLGSVMNTPSTQLEQTASPAEVARSFSEFMTNALEKVDQAQVESSQLNQKYMAGEITDIHNVMISSQKAAVMLQMTMEVRNKAVEAYQEIMRMQV
ncbi:flagellar hook-basal body complex protein FliE [Brevibacillus daliensis]|uniref:flagellar hook-basal body complex protein FliE n=1 Tax=Brevibacillus daliensis TaxID=2892995 RepID=UPI001E637A7E|nr:flagellar hook-basal body complex protein FliE [Brevibacillus daliensis]